MESPFFVLTPELHAPAGGSAADRRAQPHGVSRDLLV